MKVVFIILLIAVGALAIYEGFSLVRTIIKIRKEKKSEKASKVTKGDNQ